MKKTNKNKIFLIILLLLIIFLIFIFLNKKTNTFPENNLDLTENKIKEVVTYSRINFFLSTENKASLAIPDYWEGSYRIKEQGNEVSFSYIKGADEEVNIFSIIFIKNNEEIKENEKFLGEKDGVVFILKNFEDNVSDDDVFYKIKESVGDVVKTFKVS